MEETPLKGFILQVKVVLLIDLELLLEWFADDYVVSGFPGALYLVYCVIIEDPSNIVFSIPLLPGSLKDC